MLFSESEIHARVASLAEEISAMPDPPDQALPILTGAFVFAADLLRALDGCGLSLPIEFLQLRSYGDTRVPQNDVRILMEPGGAVSGRHVLLIDGVLDRGHTLAKGRDLALGAGVRKITTVVAVDKRREDALLTADFAGFAHVREFIVGYGMDDAGQLRSLPYIATAR
ncbi:MAG TPA: phosphoribosyltransferase family protein [Rhizomicrobium sp.]